jgi:hypothetical protein
MRPRYQMRVWNDSEDSDCVERCQELLRRGEVRPRNEMKHVVVNVPASAERVPFFLYGYNFVSDFTRNVKGPHSSLVAYALVGVCVYVTAGDCSTDVGAHANALLTAAATPSSKFLGGAEISEGT